VAPVKPAGAVGVVRGFFPLELGIQLFQVKRRFVCHRVPPWCRVRAAATGNDLSRSRRLRDGDRLHCSARRASRRWPMILDPIASTRRQRRRGSIRHIVLTSCVPFSFPLFLSQRSHLVWRLDPERDRATGRRRQPRTVVLRARGVRNLLSQGWAPLIAGIITEDGVPAIEVEVAGQRWRAIVDTGFNGERELARAPAASWECAARWPCDVAFGGEPANRGRRFPG
jgi:hypothetical protein